MLDPETLWPIKTDANVVPVPLPVRKINSKGTAVLNARRAGQWRRQIQEEAQDYSGFGLKPQTPAPKSAQPSRAPARAADDAGDGHRLVSTYHPLAI
jgi:hypothetical protein